MKRGYPCLLVVSLGFLAASGGLGCSHAGYQTRAVIGEFKYLSKAISIEQALSPDSDLTDDQRRKLAFVVRARDFGTNVVGLKVGKSWQRFVNTCGKPVATNLSASPKDCLKPYVWHLAIGPMPYLGFFDPAEAKKEKDRLIAEGYDTVSYPVDAFSTLGVLPDPVSSALLERSFPSIADTVLHELTHNTISRLKDTNFNETLAVFVGRTAAVQFLSQEFGPDSSMVHEAKDGYEDDDRINTFLQAMIADLKVLYSGSGTTEEKIAKRAVIIKAHQKRFTGDVLPLMHDQKVCSRYGTIAINNAFLLLHVRYNDSLEVFQQVFDRNGEDWSQTLKVFKRAAAHRAPVDYLRGTLAAGG